MAQEIDAGLASAALAELAALVEGYPLRERLRVLLVKALYAVGRQADALAAYTRARRYLADEVGLEPGPELRAMEAAVLAQDSSLSTAPTRFAAAPPVPVTPLVGRDSDLATLRTALTMARLVTLSGPGGVGKPDSRSRSRLRHPHTTGRCGLWSSPLSWPAVSPRV